MKTYIDCIPCLFKQVLDSSRMYTASPVVQERLMREVMGWCRKLDMSKPIPVMGRQIYRRLRRITGVADPYSTHKRAHNRMALRLLPGLRRKLAAARDPFGLAVKISMAGNIIDMGGAGDVSLRGVRRALGQALTEPVKGDIRAFRAAARAAKDILYITDNAGEIVFDRLLIEQLGPERVTVAVRGAPVLNDAIMADARAAGLHKICAALTDSGSDAPGTILADVPPRFMKLFKRADMVIAKGMGNYETLCDAPRPVYFLFRAKCPMVAKHAGVRVGDHVLACGKRKRKVRAV